MNQKISVVVPVYNIENEIKECLDSICRQSYTNLEIILVDDGSSDHSGKICDEYALRDNRIVVIHQENQGLVRARKNGLNRASSEYVLNIDGDDWIDPEMVERLLVALEENQADIVWCGFQRESSQPHICSWNKVICHLDENKCQEIFEAMIQDREIFSIAIFNKLFKKEVLKQAYEKIPDELSYGEDYCAFIHYITPGTTLTCIPDVLYHYRIREDSLSHEKKGAYTLLESNRLMDYLQKVLKQNYKNLDKRLLESWILQRNLRTIQYVIDDSILHVSAYKFGNTTILRRKQIVIYGAGKVGRDYVNQLSEFEDVSITGWVDVSYSKYQYEFRKVLPVSTIMNMKYDYIVIAVMDDAIRQSVFDELQQRYHVAADMIIDLKPERVW